MELLEDLNRDYQRYRFTPRERSFLGLQGLQPVLSSNVAAVGVRNTELLIRFHNGSVYSYRGKADQYENILKSNSKGKWVWRNLRRKNAPYEKIGVIPLPDDIGVTDEDIFQEIDNRYLADLTRHVDVPVFQSFTFINGINMQKIVVGNINVFKPITDILPLAPEQPIAVKPSQTIEFNPNDYKDVNDKVKEKSLTILNNSDNETKEAIVDYTTSFYSNYNGYLRGDIETIDFIKDRGMEKEVLENIDRISSATTNTLGSKVKLYRGMFDIGENIIDKNILDSLGTELSQGLIDYMNADKEQLSFMDITNDEIKLYDEVINNMAGTTFVDKGFTSTTYDSEFKSFGSIRMVIYADENTKGVVIDSISKQKVESEVLLNKGTKFEIIDIKKGMFEKLVMNVRVVNDE